MTANTLKEVLALIEGSYLMCNMKFEPAVQQLYVTCLLPMDDVNGLKAVTSLVHGSEWPPKPVHVRDRYAELVSPTPDAEEAWTELSDLIDRFSVNGIPHEYQTPEGRTRLVHLRGAPKFSHPLVEQALNELCGGYIAFCEGAVSNRQPGGYVKAFKDTYTRLRSKWCQSVADAISGGSRPQNLFPSYVPYQKPAQRQLGAIKDGSENRRKDTGERVPMPDHVAERIERAFQHKMIGSKLDLEA